MGEFGGVRFGGFITTASVAANLICLVKRKLLPPGLNPHFIFGVSGVWFKLVSYAFFGFLSGVVASISVRLRTKTQ